MDFSGYIPIPKFFHLPSNLKASRNRPEQPPPYGPPAYGNYYPAPPPAYAPPSDPYYAWVPYQTFPTAPPGR